MKYLVMECHPGYAVVLSEDGKFLKAANLRYEVGQTVSDIIEVRVPQAQVQPQKTNYRRWTSALAAMAACLVLMVTSFLYGQMPYASVFMTINPQIRIDVNRSDRVVDVEGVNDDGELLLEGYDPGKKELDTVMDELVDRAINMGYLHEGGRIMLSLDGSEAWVSSHRDYLNDHLQAHLEEKITVTIDVQQKQPEAPKPAASTVPTAPAGPIVIPVVPDRETESDYEEVGDDTDYEADSGYGETEADSGYEAESDYGETEADSGYEAESDYGETEADSGYEAESDYGETEADSGYDTDSGYGETEADSGYGASDYEDPDGAGSDYAGESEYDSPAHGGAASGDTAPDYGESNYEPPVPGGSDYGDSGYEEPEHDSDSGGQSDYGQSEYEESDYDD